MRDLIAKVWVGNTLPTDNPWRNAELDLQEGYDFLDFWLDQYCRGSALCRNSEVDPDDFSVTRTWWPVTKLSDYLHYEEALQPVEPGSLEHADTKQILTWAESFRAADEYFVDEGDVPFVDRVADILRHGFPAVVVVESQRLGVRELVDGYGRYYLALALGVQRLPVLLLCDRTAS